MICGVIVYTFSAISYFQETASNVIPVYAVAVVYFLKHAYLKDYKQKPEKL